MKTVPARPRTLSGIIHSNNGWMDELFVFKSEHWSTANFHQSWLDVFFKFDADSKMSTFFLGCQVFFSYFIFSFEACQIKACGIQILPYIVINSTHGWIYDYIMLLIIMMMIFNKMIPFHLIQWDYDLI